MGVDYSIMSRDSTFDNTGNYGWASKRKMKMRNGMISSIKIGDIDFRNTAALNGDMQDLKEQISNFGELIGQTIKKLIG